MLFDLKTSSLSEGIMFAITYLSFPLLKPIYQANTIHAGSHIISSYFSLSFQEKATTVVIWNRVVRTARPFSIFRSHTPTHHSQPNLAVQGFPWGMLTTNEQRRQVDNN